ncbi:Tubby-like F-box protein 6 [Hibiscus syriacus]|uniref:Tubby-like F-box protein 6 n=1 Tax=Hibiscus syriacus TaxID=106335 RepID=A0A6A2YAG8_HIBSY|nr:tubby-like F-box protein 5 isoform X2 [Hibiscus syriacus]KAE8674506.1 Tubby-like F-box protein 6 [Hibiscus syriacus]
MPFKSFVREIGKISKEKSGTRHKLRRGQAHITPEASLSSSPGSSTVQIEHRQWENLPPELLVDIIQRVESREQCWPGRRDVVACASVCRSWREITKHIVKTPEHCGFLTFPISLKQPGPRDTPIQCFIRRDSSTSTFRLYMGLSPALSGELSKLLLAAKKVRRATGIDFVICLVGDDFSRSSNKYVGKLRSNFLGTKFNIFDSQPPEDSIVRSCCQSCQKTRLEKLPSRVTMNNYNTAKISYQLNVLRTRGPRRMQCTMHSIPVSAIEEREIAPTPMAVTNCLEHSSSLLDSTGIRPQVGSDSTGNCTTLKSMTYAPLVLKNKVPRWHEQLQCWCLNFKGRVTVASVKNFQLVAAVEPSQNVTVAEQENVILQFGKIGKDIFTMDYRYPLSAFQAFAICLSSFDTKPVCE